MHENLGSGTKCTVEEQLEGKTGPEFIGIIGTSTRGSGVRYGALAVESGGAGPKAGPLEVW